MPDGVGAGCKSAPMIRLVLRMLAFLVLGAGFVWGANYLLLGRPVVAALASDSRNEGYRLTAHYRYYLEPGVVVLDLTRVNSAAPVDLIRGLFQTASVLDSLDRAVSQVVIARNGAPVYLLTGREYRAIGAAYRSGENPMFLIRTLPEKLAKPDGTPAFGTWTGGLLGVTLRQMDDVGAFGRTWVGYGD